MCGCRAEAAPRAAFVLGSGQAGCVMPDLHSGSSSCLPAADRKGRYRSSDGIGPIRRHTVETWPSVMHSRRTKKLLCFSEFTRPLSPNSGKKSFQGFFVSCSLNQTNKTKHLPCFLELNEKIIRAELFFPIQTFLLITLR